MTASAHHWTFYLGVLQEKAITNFLLVKHNDREPYFSKSAVLKPASILKMFVSWIYF